LNLVIGIGQLLTIVMLIIALIRPANTESCNR